MSNAAARLSTWSFGQSSDFRQAERGGALPRRSEGPLPVWDETQAQRCYVPCGFPARLSYRVGPAPQDGHNRFENRKSNGINSV